MYVTVLLEQYKHFPECHLCVVNAGFLPLGLHSKPDQVKDHFMYNSPLCTTTSPDNAYTYSFLPVSDAVF